jgi:hypothetical protein
MRVLNLDTIANAPTVLDPYRHFAACGVLQENRIRSVEADFPHVASQGTLAIDDVPVHGAFSDLLHDLRNPVFTTLMGKKLGLDLTGRPVFITISKWSKRTDGRIHTDSAGKLATFLMYFNAGWAQTGDGCLRVLKNDHDFEDYAEEIRPVLGNSFGFRRSENSWHGFRSFVGERRMLQTTWLVDDSKLVKKRRAGRRAAWLRRLNPFAWH